MVVVPTTTGAGRALYACEPHIGLALQSRPRFARTDFDKKNIRQSRDTFEGLGCCPHTKKGYIVRRRRVVSCSPPFAPRSILALAKPRSCCLLRRCGGEDPEEPWFSPSSGLGSKAVPPSGEIPSNSQFRRADFGSAASLNRSTASRRRGLCGSLSRHKGRAISPSLESGQPILSVPLSA